MSRIGTVVGLTLILTGCTTISLATPTPPSASMPPITTPAATIVPTPAPTVAPPTAAPATPTLEPTAAVTDAPTVEPTSEPTVAPTPTSVTAACADPIFPEDLGNDHLDAGVDFTGTYSSDPPTSGPHDPTPTEAGQIYTEPQRNEELVHAMEHGAVIFWNNGLTTEQDEAAQAAVVAAYSSGYESLIYTVYPDMDVPFAMTAWGVLQTCTDIDPTAIQAFIDSYYGSGLEGILACGGGAAELPGCNRDAAPTDPPESDFPDADEAALLEFVPEAFRDTCTRPFGEGVDVVADVDCFPTDTGADQTGYNQFANLEIMNQSYDTTRDFLEIPASQGQCAEAEQWPADGTYTIGEETAGRIMCTDTFTGSSIIWWTDELLNIKSVAISTDGDREALYEFWANESGPVRP